MAIRQVPLDGLSQSLFERPLALEPEHLLNPTRHMPGVHYVSGETGDPGPVLFAVVGDDQHAVGAGSHFPYAKLTINITLHP